MLCDFGLSRLEEAVPSGLTTTLGVEGTMTYLSPECVDGAKRTAQSDVWAWGCLFLQVRVLFAPRFDWIHLLIMIHSEDCRRPVSVQNQEHGQCYYTRTHGGSEASIGPRPTFARFSQDAVGCVLGC